MSLTTTPPIRQVTDTYVVENRPSDNYRATDRLVLRSSPAGSRMEVLMHWGRPFPRGAYVQGATLNLRVMGSWAALAGRTLTVERITTQFRVGRITGAGWWPTPPTTTTNSSTVSVAGIYNDGDIISVPVTGIMSDIAGGENWYGVRIYLSGTAETNKMRLYSGNAPKNKPSITATFGLPPNKPTGLKPSGGRVVSTQFPVARYAFSDPDGAGSLTYQQFQLDSTGDFSGTTGPEYESPPILTDQPQQDFNALPIPPNINPNYGADTNTVGWGGGANSTVGRTTNAAQYRTAPGGFTLTSVAAGAMSTQTTTGTGGIPVIGNRTYIVTGWAKSLTVARSFSLNLSWYDAAGAFISTTSAGSVTTNLSTFAGASYIWGAPSNARFVSIGVQIATPAAAGEVHYFDDITLNLLNPADAANPLKPQTGDTVYWRVRAQDESGLWSPYSDVVSYVYTGLPANPTISSPLSTTTDPTPPVIWTTAFTQGHWQVITTKTSTGKVVDDTGIVAGTQQSYTIPKGVITQRGVSYTTEVRTWDTVDREPTPGLRAYSTSSITFTYTAGATTGVTGLTLTDLGTALDNYGAQLDWVRAAGAPDQFEVTRDNVQVDIYEAADVLITSTTFRLIDRMAEPRKPHTWRVRAIVNGIASADSAAVSGTHNPVGWWLIDTVAGTRVQFLDTDEGSWDMQEVSEVKWALGATRPTKVTQGLGGYTADLTGRIVSFASTTHDTAMATLWAMKAAPSRQLRLVIADMNIPVIVSRIVPRPTPRPEMEKVVTIHVDQDGGLYFDAEV